MTGHSLMNKNGYHWQIAVVIGKYSNFSVVTVLPLHVGLRHTTASLIIFLTSFIYCEIYCNRRSDCVHS